MTDEKPSALRCVVLIIKIVSTVSIVIATTLIGAFIGWENHGLVGAMALAFVGLVAGGLLSSPSALLQVIS